MIRNIYGYKTFNHVVFTGFLPGFISVHGCFCSTTQDQNLFTQTHLLIIFTMASKEHTYAIPDSTVASLHLLCRPDFDFDYPDTVPFHVTEMDSTFLRIQVGTFFEQPDFITTVRFNVQEFNDFYLGIMACFIDEESERNFIDVSSTSEGQEEGATGGPMATANLPAPPHQAPIEVRQPLVVFENQLGVTVTIHSSDTSCLLTQVQLDRQIDDALIVERIEQFLGLQIDPTDLRTCAFGKLAAGQVFLSASPHCCPFCFWKLGPFIVAFPAELIRALWDLTRTCFAHLNGPQRVRVLKRLVSHHAGHMLQRDSELLTAALFGDNADQGRNDPLLVGIINTLLGGDQGIGNQLGTSLVLKRVTTPPIPCSCFRHLHRKPRASGGVR